MVVTWDKRVKVELMDSEVVDSTPWDGQYFVYFSLQLFNGVLQVSTSIHKSSFGLELQ